jgi:amino acid adenylation domain-containing protein/non-ribosomal peptide synthase protein (TIGR01720 family)
MPTMGRPEGRFDGLVGYFVNPVALRSTIDRTEVFLALLRSVQLTLVDALDHAAYPFSCLARDLKTQRTQDRSPVFQVLFDYKSRNLVSAPVNGARAHALVFEPLKEIRQEGEYELVLETWETENGGFSLMIAYDPNLFEQETMERLTGHLEMLVESAVANPEQPISAMEMLTESESGRWLREWNDVATEYPRGKTIHQLFEGHAEKTPEAIAVVHEGRRLTYGELNRKSNQVAHYLRSAGVKTETMVGLCMERSPEMLVAMLGILKAGGVYLPVDPDYPQTRMRFMFEDAKVRIVLTQQCLLERLTDLVLPGCCCALDTQDMDFSADNLTVAQSPQNLAYVIYTSGSTGNPKGITIPHEAVVRLVRNTNYISIRPDDNFAQASNASFDAATFEIWGALLNGARLTIIPRNDSLNHEVFAKRLKDESITTLFVTTALFNQYVRNNPEIFHSLRYVLFGGEAVDPTAVRHLLESKPPQHLLHVYGPTENTTFSSWHSVATVRPDAVTVPIGKSIANTRMYVLDDDLNLVPPGVIGELYIGGVGLARCYLNRPANTAECFVPDPFGTTGDRLYRSGDRVRCLANGDIEFVGRGDFQVKIRGFRVELSEIEAELLGQASVKECVVELRQTDGRKQLVAYLAFDETFREPDVSALRGRLKERLPDYMVPGIFVCLPSLPLTPNGKVDRKALPAPDVSEQMEEQHVCPRTPVEETLAQIWKDVLKVPRVGVQDNFFEIGGDSILAIQIVARANQAGIKLTAREILTLQTVAELADAAVKAGAEKLPKERGAVEGEVSLTPIQRWFFEQDPVEPHHFNQSVLLQCRSKLQPDLLQRAIEALANHHDALRLRFTEAAGEWRQHYLPPDHRQVPPFEYVDLSALEFSRRSVTLTEVAERIQAGLNIEAGPILRVALFDLGEEQSQRLLIVINHLVVDAVSWRILVEDLQTAYQQLEAGEMIRLPARTTSFKDWAAHLTIYATQEAVRQELPYWQGLQQHNHRSLPLDHTAGANTVASARTVAVSLSAGETEALLREAPRVYQTQINEVLLCALASAFARWNGHPTLTINLEGHGREDLFADVDLSRTVGWFTTIFPVQLNIGDVSDPIQLVPRVREQLREIPNRGLGYGVLRYLDKNSSLRVLSDPEISFNYLGQIGNAGHDDFFLPASEYAGSSRSPRAHRRHLIEINSFIAQNRLQAAWTYSETLHDRKTIEVLAEHFIASLRALIENGRRMQTPDVHSKPFTEALNGFHPGGESSNGNHREHDADPQLPVEGEVPLTPIQNKVVAFMGEDFRKNVLQTTWECRQTIVPELLHRALRALVLHHDALRLRLAPSINGWRQWSTGAGELEKCVLLERTDLSAFESVQLEDRVEEVKAHLRKSLDPSTPPLLRAGLLEMGNDRPQLLCLAMHHLALDVVSLFILMQELETAYRQLSLGREIELSPQTSSFKSWAKRLKEYAASAELEAEAAYWRSLPWDRCVSLPVDYMGEARSSSKAAYEAFSLDKTNTRFLQSVQRKLGAQMDEVLLAAMVEMLAGWTGQDTFCVNLMHHGRVGLFPELDLSRTVGWFSNEIPALVKIDAAAGPAGILKDVEAQLRNIPNDGIGYGILRYMSGHELFQLLPAAEVRLNHQGQANPVKLDSLFTPVQSGGNPGTALDCKIELRTLFEGGHFKMIWLYDENVHNPTTILYLAAKFENCLRNMIASGEFRGEESRLSAAAGAHIGQRIQAGQHALLQEKKVG